MSNLRDSESDWEIYQSRVFDHTTNSPDFRDTDFIYPVFSKATNVAQSQRNRITKYSGFRWILAWIYPALIWTFLALVLYHSMLPEGLGS